MKIKNVEFHVEPYQHQIDAVKKAWGKKGFAYTGEQGTGKTYSIIIEMALLFSMQKINRALIIAPKGAEINWLNELKKYWPKSLKIETLYYKQSLGVKGMKRFDHLAKPTTRNEFRVLSINWDLLKSKKVLENVELFLENGIAYCIADESHYMKNPQSQRCKALNKIKHLFRLRRIASGTPILNAPFDAYSQYNWLDINILNCGNYFAFKRRHAVLINAGHPLYEAIKNKANKKRLEKDEKQLRRIMVVAKDKHGMPQYRNVGKLAEQIELYSFRILKKDCLDLPDKIYQRHYFELTPKQKAIYKRLDKELILELEHNMELAEKALEPIRNECVQQGMNEEEIEQYMSSRISAYIDIRLEQIVSITKLMQLTSGFVINPVTNKAEPIDDKNPKLELFGKRIEELKEEGKNAIIWCNMNQEIELIKNELNGAAYATYTGSTNSEDRMKAVDDFQNGNIQFFIGNEAAGSTAITLNKTENVLYYSNRYNLAHRLQSEDRAHRIGTKKNVVYEDFIALNTIEEKMIAALQMKKRLGEIINRDNEES